MAAAPIPPPRPPQGGVAPGPAPQARPSMQQAPLGQQGPQPPPQPQAPQSPVQAIQARIADLMDKGGYEEDTIYGMLKRDRKVMAQFNDDPARLRAAMLEVIQPRVLAKQTKLEQEKQTQEPTLAGRTLDFGMGALSNLPRIANMKSPKNWLFSLLMGGTQTALGSGAGDITSPENRGAAAQGVMNLLERNTKAGRRFAQENPFLNVTGQGSLSNIAAASGGSGNTSLAQQVVGGAGVPAALGVFGAYAAKGGKEAQQATEQALLLKQAVAQEARILQRAQVAQGRYKKYLGAQYPGKEDMLVRTTAQDRFLERVIGPLKGKLSGTKAAPGQQAMYNQLKGLTSRMGGDKEILAFAKTVQQAGGSNQYISKVISDIFNPAEGLLESGPKKELFQQLDKYRKFYEGSGVDMQKVLQDETLAHFVEQLSDPKRNATAAIRLKAVMERPGLHKDSAAFFTKIFGSADDSRVRGLHGLARVTDVLSDKLSKVEASGKKVPESWKKEIWPIIGRSIFWPGGKIEAMLYLLRKVDAPGTTALKDINRIVNVFATSAERDLEAQDRAKEVTRISEGRGLLSEEMVPPQVPPAQIPTQTPLVLPR